MKGIAGHQIRGLQQESEINVIDNTGAKVISIITVPDYHGVSRRIPKAGVGDFVIASVKKGTPAMRRQIVYAVIVRQRRPYRRPDGTDIKGPVAREAADRWPRIAATANTIV